MSGLSPRFKLVLAHAIALALFVHGFLLTRVHLPKDQYSSSDAQNALAPQPHPAPYKRLVWIVVDALRYDFVVDDGRYGHSKRNADMPFLSSFVGGVNQDVQAHARVARYIADAPTTTTQRLKSMTTGSLPIFFDVSNAFSAAAVDEDNLIDGLRNAGKRMVFMGDSTWHGLYPAQFHESHPFPCYNIMDLDSVDDGVNALLVPMIQSASTSNASQPEWDVIIAHYLGVDHAGHAYGVDSPEMKAKLRQIDSAIRDVIGALEPSRDTLMLVVGDHGQTLTGDHGGGSPEEVDSVLVAIDVDAYYGRKSSSVSSSTSTPAVSCTKNCTCGEDRNQCAPDVTQIDLVPTLAGFLGIPIPFVNLGKVSGALWSLVGDGHDSFLRMLEDNALQVHRYLETYSKQPGARLSSSMMTALRGDYAALSAALASASAPRPQDYIDYLSSAEALARSMWTQFHEGWMLTGCAVFIGAVAFQGSLLHARWQRLLVTPTRPTTTVQAAYLLVPWIINLIHPAGIFSFFFLLSEGKYTSWIVILVASSVYWPRRHHPSAMTGLILTCAACFLVSTLGLQSHSGFGFWQRLTVHDEHAPERSMLSPSTPPTELSAHARLVIHYLIPTAILSTIFHIYATSRSLLRGLHTIYRAYLVAGTVAMLAYHTVVPISGTDGYIPAQVCYAFVASICLLSLGTRLIKPHRLSATETLIVLSAALAILLTLISPVATPLLLLGVFGEVYGMYLMCVINTKRDDELEGQERSSSFSLICCLTAVQSQAFYVSGHLCEFSGLLYTTAFVGQKDYDIVKGGLLLGFDTCGCMVIVAVVGLLLLTEGDAYHGPSANAPTTRAATKRPARDKPWLHRGHRRYLQECLPLLSLGASTTCCAAMLSAGIQRRHLYAWALFAPKFVFEAYFCLVLDIVALLFGALL